MLATLGALKSKRVANTLLPAVSAVLMLDGVIGFGYHIRGILRRPAGKKKPLYNILYGPPIFAPLLFAACGMLGHDGVPDAAGALSMADERQRTHAVYGSGDWSGRCRKREQPGYYPGFSTLSQKRYWDAATRHVVEERVSRQKPIRFFTPEEARTMEAVVDRILPQDDRTDERRIPILPGIDERCIEDRLDGYRFEDMPPDQEAYRIGLRAFEADGADAARPQLPSSSACASRRRF